MNIKFSWKRDDGRYRPVSTSDLVNEDGVSLLDCVLMDDGGLPYLETIPWLNEGVKRIKSVATGGVESADWDRETWGVELRDHNAKIYSLYNQEYFQTLSLDAFLRVLQMWVAFLQSEPDELEAGTHDLSIDG